MIYVKLVRSSFEKTTCEMLNVKDYISGDEVTDKLLLCEEFGSDQYGYMVTQEDLQMLYNIKKEACRALYEKQKTEKEKKIDEQLNELKEIKRKQEERSRKFPWCLFRKFTK